MTALQVILIHKAGYTGEGITQLTASNHGLHSALLSGSIDGDNQAE